jgi:hypothetical protein
MRAENSIQRYRRWYARLLRYYSKSYNDQFGEGMQQTFTDLLRERADRGKGLLGCAVGMFLETSAGIIKENGVSIIMRNRNIIRIALVTAIILLVPLVAMQFTDEVHWSAGDFIAAAVLLLGAGFAYELVAKKTKNTIYRFAVGVAVGGAFLLVWVNGAVGIIGSENQPANLLYGAVFVVGVVGTLIARFRPRGMSLALFAAAFVQLLIPVVARIAWPQVSWGAAGMFGVFAFNAFFVMLFVVSGLLFRRAMIVEAE